MNRFLRLLFLSLTFVINAYAQTPDANGIVYVKTGGTGTGDSWANASGNLSDALKAATTNTAIKQIWVSGGTWLPNYPADFSSADNRDKTFLLVKDVKLYGGFAGTETTLAERNLSLTANKTILSGDLGTVDDLNDNAYHVMIASGDVGTAEINGITIMKGTSTTGSSTNTLTVNGNGIMRIAGGGIILYGAAPAINNVIICGNQAIAGAGVYIGYNSSPKITNCIINGNYANISGSGNGGGLFAYQSTPLFTNVVIAGNNAAGWGGALAISSSTLTFNNSIIYGNGTSNPIYNLSGSYTAQYTMVQNVAANATNHNPSSTDPYFVNAPSSSNAPFTEGDYSLTSSSPLIDLGSNSLYTGLSATSTDLVGKPRVANYSSGGIIDLGAIEYQPLTSQTITVADAVKTYGDADFEPVASSSSGLAVTLQSSDASIAQPYIDAADGNKWKIKILKAGVATITVSQSGNSVYAAATNETFTVTINKAPLTITASDLTKLYDGISFSGGNGVTYSGFVNGEDSSTALTGTLVYNGTSQGATAVNSYTIVPSGLIATNYDITYASGTLTINKAALTITASDLTKTYDGISFSGGNGVTYSGFVNGEDASAALTGTLAYAGTSQGATTVNSYTIIPSGLTATNYDITYASGTLTINKAALTITASDLTKIYDGISFSGGNGVTYSGFVNGEDASTAITGTIAYTGTSQGAIAVNSYTIIPSGLTASNYDITYASGTLTINKAALTITASDLTKTYDGISFSGGNGVTYSGFVNGEDASTAITGTIAYTGTSQGAIAVNSYTIIPSGLIATNYDITYASGILTINKAALTITASDLTKTYDGISFSGGNGVTYSGFVNGEDASAALTGTINYAGTSQGATVVNSYTIIPSGLSATNYDITYASGTLTINKAALTITASDLTKTYDGISFSGGNGVTYSGFVNGEDASTTLTGTLTYTGTSQGATTVNSYTIIPSGLIATNYDITYASGTLTINKATLTITASDLTKTYDGISFSGGNGVTYSGFVNGEDASTTLTGTLTYTGTSQGATTVSSYTIIPSGLTATNYDITYATGTLTINKAALTITASDLTKTYDGIPFSGGNGVTYNGFVNGEDALAALTGTLTYTGTSQGATTVNSYTIIPSGLIATNYDITYTAGTLTINKAALTITASDLTKIYDGISFSGGNGVTYSGFVNGEDASTAITGTITYSGTSQGATTVSSYTIIPSGLTATNYDITYAAGTLTINKAALSITANDLTKIYDGISFSGGNGVTYSGFVNGEDASTALTGTLAYNGTSQGAIAVNSYTIIPSGLIATNYDITYASGTLTINKAALTITASDLTKTYDGIPFSGGNGVTYSGFVNGEDASTALTGTLAYNGTSQGATVVNSYTIIPSGLTATNYDITYATGTLNISKAALVITASDLTKTYDGIPFSGGNGVTYNGFVNGEDASAALTGTITYTGTSQGATAVNSYTIIPSGLTASNYDITYATGTLTINKAALTITADNKARCFGANDPSFTFTYNGWVNGESITELAAQPVATTIATAATTAGNYDIIPSGAAASNYTITYVNGTLTIYALPAATLSATEGSVLCGNNATITLTASGNYTYQWLLDNSQINGGETGTLSLTTTGVYTAVATDGNGCTANATNSITVSRILPPTASFTFNTYCENTAVTFTNTSDIHTSGVVDYTWSSGDGQTDNNTDAHFTYTTPGDFTVSLTATPQECPLLAATSTQIINIASQLAATRLTTINTTSGLPTQLSARNLSDAVYTWTPSTGLSDVTIYNPIATIQSSQEYQIQMVFPSGCITTDTLLVNPTIRYDIIAANAFTPNGDGTNDVFRVNLRGVKEFKFLRIYDRWGNKIYQTNDPAKGWDGRYGGVLQQVGTYIWNAEAIDTNGQIIQRQGVVTLLH